jgi:hypothetical protein
VLTGPPLGKNELTPVVRRALGSPTAEVAEWTAWPLGGGVGVSSGGVYRVEGTCVGRDGRRPWATVLKVLRQPADTGRSVGPHASIDSGDLSHPNYWRREALAYGSGYLERLAGGLQAPRCWGIEDRPDGDVWLWLEALEDDVPDPWPIDRYYLAARHLGEFGGAHLASGAPPEPWFAVGGLRPFVEGFAGAYARYPEVRDHPWVRRGAPGALAGRVLALWEEHGALLDVLDRLPQTVCHGDAGRTNLFARRAGGVDRTVAIDWQYAGLNALGSDVKILVGGTVAWFRAELEDLPALSMAAVDGYADGLHAAGWRGDPRLVRLGYALATGVMIGASPFGAWLALDPGWVPRIEAAVGRPAGEFLDRTAALQAFVLDQLDEVRSLVELL